MSLNESKLRIVFMGTPEFAVPTLESLHKSRHEVVAVVTSVDKLGGRGKKKLLESAIKKYAKQENIPVLQPKNLKSDEFNQELKSFEADIQVVVAFRMLPVKVWDMPKLGTINLHGSLLPAFRGAAPINWAVITGQEVTGLTTFKLKHEIDTGNMIQQVKIRIGDNDTAGDVHDKLMLEGGPLMLATLEDLVKGDVNMIVQDESKVSKAPKIFRETCQINFGLKALAVHNHIRGLSPYPGAWSTLANGVEIKILESSIPQVEALEPSVVDDIGKLKPFQILTDNKSNLMIGTEDGAVQILQAQLAGKKRMKIKDLLNGYKFEQGTFMKFGQ